MRHATWRAGCSGLVCIVPLLAHAADDAADKMKGFGLAETAAAPAFGRVIVVFLLLAALAWAAAWLLRRYGKQWRIPAAGGGGVIRPLARSTLPGGIELREAHGVRERHDVLW